MPLERDMMATVTKDTADARAGAVVKLVRRHRHDGTWFWDCLEDTGGDYQLERFIPEDALEAKR